MVVVAILAEEVGVSIVQSLLKPTKIYVNATVPLIKRFVSRYL